MPMSKRLLLVLISLSLLAGCGFKLRGSYELSTQLPEISIEGGNRAIVERLTAIWTGNDIAVVATGSGAPTLSLSRVEFDKETVSTDATGIATEFEYTYLVEFSVMDANGEVLLPQSSISVFNTLEYDPGDELEFEEEEEFLKEEMEQDIALQITRELARL